MRSLLPVILVILLTACGPVQASKAGPVISDVSTSGKILVISDCQGTSITFNARVNSQFSITNVSLWYRVGSDQPFKSIPMSAQGNHYRAVVQGKDLQGGGYGDLEFYIAAEDWKGNTSKSPVDKSIQFLPCVNH
jgi:hypothetical protein